MDIASLAGSTLLVAAAFASLAMIAQRVLKMWNTDAKRPPVDAKAVRVVAIPGSAETEIGSEIAEIEDEAAGAALSFAVIKPRHMAKAGEGIPEVLGNYRLGRRNPVFLAAGRFHRAQS